MKRRIEKLVLAFILLLFLLLSSREKAEENSYTLLYSQLPVVKLGEQYKKLFRREPPIGFDQWVQFAKEKKCLLNLSFYSQIYRDLEPWIHEKHDVEFGQHIAHVKEMFFNSISKSYLDMGYVLQGNFNATSRLFSAGNHQTLELLNSIGHLVHYNFEYLLNNLDEPISLPASDNHDLIYHSIADAINGSSCLQNIGQAILDSHGFFIAPNSNNPFSFNGILPIFSQAKHHCYKDILAPNKFHIDLAKQGLIKDNVRWEEKMNVLFWRGISTGGSNTVGQPWEKYHRIRLLEWEKKYAQKHSKYVFDAGKMSESLHELSELEDQNSSNIFVDIGLYDYVHCDEKTLQIFHTKYPVKNRVSFEKTMKFKYLLVVDGNTWASRIQTYLQTNSIILYNGVFTDHYLWMLKPWVHYVPIRTDLEDLDEKLEWLIANDKKAQSIVENANAFMHEIGRYEHLQCYTGLLMQEYGRIFGASSK